MSRLKRHKFFSLQQALTQLQNDSDSGEEFVNKDSDPLWDTAASFHEDSDGIEPIPSTSRGVTDASQIPNTTQIKSIHKIF